MTALTMKRGLFLGLLSALGGWLYVNRGAAKKMAEDATHPAPAFADKGGHKAQPTQVRDAGPSNMRDKPGKWDKVDEASDASFPASDPSATY